MFSPAESMMRIMNTVIRGGLGYVLLSGFTKKLTLVTKVKKRRTGKVIGEGLRKS
jgi:hypothetical protein